MLAVLAFRNLGRNRRRTLLTLCATVMSCALLILALGIFSGMLEDILDSATGQYHGHLVLTGPGYPEGRSLFEHFPQNPDLMEELRGAPGVLGASPRLRSFGLLSHETIGLPVELLGIVEKQERSVTSLGTRLLAGAAMAEAEGERPPILLGQALAKRLGARPGDELVFMTQAADGSIGNDLLRVAGIFSSGDQGRDNQLALVPLGWLQQLLVLPGELHELALRVEAPMEAPELAERLRQDPALQGQDLRLRHWGQLLPTMREAIAGFDVSRMILILILYCAAGLGILNTFFMSVMERTRELGILLAMGMTPGRIRGMILLEALLLGLPGLGGGTALGGLATLYMREIGIDLSAWLTPVTYAGGTIAPRLRASFEAVNFWQPGLALLAVCLLAGYFPARRASKLRPTEAIREDG